ncbi:MAG: SusD/RagB family nutrient-binding outer membrane lipoprotein [Bacteroidetes bacterium]|nr:SusD/RagB family nutrient-binding outer membrane lipoprotein [Bacteroidota bacterium]
MKRLKYNLAILVAGILMLSSCKDNFYDINVNPNNPSKATPALVLPSGLASTAFVMGGYYQALGGFWTQQYAEAPAASQWADWESYNLTEDDFDGRQFSTLYAGPLYDYEYVRKSASTSGNWSFYAISTLMQAYTFQVLADLYDKIPFTEALKGVTTIQPHYDNGSVVYDSLLARIDGAMAKDFTASSSKNPGASDVVFQGDMTKWQKFANTLKLKMYLRYVNVDPNKYKTQIQALLAANNFLTTDATFASFKAEQTGYNPFFNTFIDGLPGNVIANKTMVDFLTNASDPRLAKIYNASVNGTKYLGLATGDSKNHSNQSIKDYSTPNVGNVSPVYFFSKEETLFLIAEAQARYGNASDAQNTFNAAVNASLLSLGLTANAVTYPYNGIQSIMEQKWIASTNKRSLEAFFDYNRTGYPDFFTRSITSILNGNDRPKRLFFPASERKSNANTPAKVALTEKVWWGK